MLALRHSCPLRLALALAVARAYEMLEMQRENNYTEIDKQDKNYRQDRKKTRPFNKIYPHFSLQARAPPPYSQQN
jgi:hypothetical protein